MKCLTIPNTGMAVTIDVGEANDIHPRNKKDVGERLALWALAKDYGKKNLVYSGPLYKGMKIEGDTVRLSFDHVGGGLMAGSKDGKKPVQEVKDSAKTVQHRRGERKVVLGRGDDRREQRGSLQSHGEEASRGTLRVSEQSGGGESLQPRGAARIAFPNGRW